MYTLYSTTVCLLLVLFQTGNGIPFIVDPGTVKDVQVNVHDTLNSSGLALASVQEPNGNNAAINESALLPADINIHELNSVSKGGGLTVNVVNKLNSDNVSVYISGLDSNKQLVFLQQDGSFHYPTASSPSLTQLGSNIAIPLGAAGTTRSLKMPGYISGGRIWAADGSLDFFVVKTSGGPSLVQPSVINKQDPNAGTSYAFAEFDWSSDMGLYADITFVDFVGLPMGIDILDTAGKTVSAVGMPKNAVDDLCNNLKEQTKRDGHPWDQLCVYTRAGNLLRVVSPASYIAINGTAFDGYFSKYGTYNWHRYSQAPLTIDTQSNAGKVKCTVDSNNTLACEGDNRGYPQPSAADIFGCSSGVFAIEEHDNAIHRAISPRLCAAFNRATLYLPAGNVQPGVPVSDYYSIHPANWYAAFVHRMEPDGRGYAFPYDDVTPTSDENVSSLIQTRDPEALTITIGGN